LKKGCFLKFIIIFTIVLAAALYIIQNKFDELFLNPGKKLATSIIENGWNNDLDYVSETPEKDSLKSLLNFYISKIKSANDEGLEQTGNIIDMLAVSFKDSLIDKEELSQFTKIIKRTFKNEE